MNNTEQEPAPFNYGPGGISQLGLTGGLAWGPLGYMLPPVQGNGLSLEPVPPKPSTELLIEAITTSYDAWQRSSFRTPAYNPDALLRSIGYDGVNEILTMAVYNRCLRFLKSIIMYKPWKTLPRVNGQVVNPDHPRYDAAMKAADLCRYVLTNIYNPETGGWQDVREVIWYMLDAVHIGYSVQELVWQLYRSGPYKGSYGLQRVVPRRPQQITFNVDPFTTQVVSLNNYTSIGGWQSYLPTRKFLLYTYHGLNGLPYGLGAWRTAYKHVTAINELLKLLIIALQKHGAGFLKGVVQNPDPVYIAKVQGILAASANGAPLVVPAGMEIELLNLPNGVLEPILGALDYHEEQIVKAILGQSLTTGQGSGSSSYALGGVHQDTQEYFVAHPRLDVEAVIKHQLYAEIVRINLGEDYFDVIPDHSQGEYDINERLKVADFLVKLRTVGILAANEPQNREMTSLAPAIEVVPPWPELQTVAANKD